MKMTNLALGTITSVLVLGAYSASAISTTTYLLDDPNAALSGYPSPYGEVKVAWADTTHATITFTGDTTGGFIYKFGANGMADVNLNATSFSVTVSTPSTAKSPVLSANNVSDFGDYNISIDNKGGASDAVSSVVFDVVNLSGTWSSSANVLAVNADGYFAAAHIFVFSPTGDQTALVTGYAGNGTTRNVPDGGSTLIMLGSALVGLFWVRRTAVARN